jgi:hypothetical protein
VKPIDAPAGMELARGQQNHAEFSAKWIQTETRS